MKKMISNLFQATITFIIFGKIFERLLYDVTFDFNDSCIINLFQLLMKF